MRLRRLDLAAVLAAALAGQAAAVSAADGDGTFAIKGVGLMTCAQYRERAGQAAVGYTVAGWLDGYVTALNQLTDDTFDFTPWESTGLLTVIIQRHCEHNPQDRLAGVIVSISRQLAHDRLEQASSLVPVYGEDNGLLVYEEVLSRTRDALTALGLLTGTAGNGFDNETRQALQRYQSRNGLPVTGLPDPATLWRLLRSPH